MLIQAAVSFGTVIMFGSAGEILTEKSGNLNLGIPGVMYVGGICGVIGAFFYEQSVASAAEMSAVLANHGACPGSGEQLIPPESAKAIRALMLTCGMYDGSGEFAMTVGFPAKSGVGGGIAAALVDRMGIGVFGPSLDEKGNSVGGIKVLEHISKNLDFNLF